MSYSDRLTKSIVAAEEHDGSVVYLYGWVSAQGIDVDMKRDMPDSIQSWASARLRDPEWSTTIRWAFPPTWAKRYPTDADFAEQLPEARRVIAAGES